MTGEGVHFVHVTDSHVCSAEDVLVVGRRTADDFRNLIDRIQQLPLEPSFVIHTGDVCGGDTMESKGDAAAYHLARSLLADLSIPQYFVAGNHDIPVLMDQLLDFGPRRPLVDGESGLSYRFQMGEVLGVVLDARRESGPAGHLPAQQLAALQNLLEESNLAVCVFTHYPPLPLGTEWADQVLLIENGLDLHHVLVRHAARVRGVFFGHVHHPIHIHREGILYIGGSSPSFHFALFPGSIPFRLIAGPPFAFNLVTVNRHETIVRSMLYNP